MLFPAERNQVTQEKELFLKNREALVLELFNNWLDKYLSEIMQR